LSKISIFDNHFEFCQHSRLLSKILIFGRTFPFLVENFDFWSKIQEIEFYHGFFKLCLSDCWEFDFSNFECKLKADKNGKNPCFDLSCDQNGIDLKFISKLFNNLLDNDQNEPFGESKSVPKWNNNLKKWHLNCPIGNCQMETSNEMVNGERYF